jgi:hypothetical protein
VNIGHNGLGRYNKRGVCLDHCEEPIGIGSEERMKEMLECLPESVEYIHYYA